MAKSFVEGLCKILVEQKVLSKKDADILQTDFSEQTKERFDDFLLSENMVDRSQLLNALAQYYQVPGFNVLGFIFNHDLLMQFPQDFLLRFGIIPRVKDENVIVMIASEPDNLDLLPELSEYVSYDIQFNVGIKKDIQDMILEFYEDPPFQATEDSFDDMDDEYDGVSVLENIFKDDE